MLDPESTLADYDANQISTDELVIPELIISTGIPVLSFICFLIHLMITLI